MKTKKLSFWSLCMMSIMLCMGFVSCSDDDDDIKIENPTVKDAILDIYVETTDDLRDIADFNVYFTDLSGEEIDITDDIAIAKTHSDGDTKDVSALKLPLELNFVMEITMKNNVKDGDYQCGYKVEHIVELLNEDGSNASSAIFNHNHSWKPSSPVSAFPKQTVKSKIIINKDAEGNITVSKD